MAYCGKCGKPIVNGKCGCTEVRPRTKFCGKCGKPLVNGKCGCTEVRLRTDFCGKCGKPLVNGKCTCSEVRPKTGFCRKCGKPLVNGKCSCVKKRKNKNRLLPIFAAVFLAVVVIGGVSVYFLLPKLHGSGSASLDIDIRAEYLEFNTLISEEPVRKSANTLTEAQASQFFADRGFGDIEITACFDEKGNYSEEAAISVDSAQKHPEYYAVYYSSTGEIWSLNLVAGKLYAAPISYNLEHMGQKQISLSESESTKVYNVDDNSYLELQPKVDDGTAKIVERIDADYLNRLTEGALDVL